MGYMSRANGNLVMVPGIPDFVVQASKYGEDGDASLEIIRSPDTRLISIIQPRWEEEFKARWIVGELEHIVKTWGQGRRISGYIEIQGEGDGIGDIDLWRLKVEDGKVVQVFPTLVWPED